MRANLSLYASYTVQSILFFLLALIAATTLLSTVALLIPSQDVRHLTIHFAGAFYLLWWFAIFFSGTLLTFNWRLEFGSYRAALLGAIVRFLAPLLFAISLHLCVGEGIGSAASMWLVVPYGIMVVVLYQLWETVGTWACIQSLENRLFGTASVVALVRCYEPPSKSDIMSIWSARNCLMNISTLALAEKGRTLQIDSADLPPEEPASGDPQKFCDHLLHVIARVADELVSAQVLPESTLERLDAHHAFVSIREVSQTGHEFEVET